MTARLIVQTLYFLLPAYIANMVPVFAGRLQVLPSLAKPIDGGFKLWGDFIFGTNKTWRGFFLGTAAAMFVCYGQFIVWQSNIGHSITIIDFSIVDPLVFGFFGGIGALAGDLLKSFVKRRVGIKSGMPWPVFDQLDFIIGYLAISLFFIPWNMPVFVTALVMTLILHPLTNVLGYALKIKNVWW